MRGVEDAVRLGRRGADGVAGGGNAEDHQSAEAGPGRFVGDGRQVGQRMLHDAGHRADRLTFGQAFLDEDRKHEIGGVQAGLADQSADRRGPAEPPGSLRQRETRGGGHGGNG